MNSAITGAGTSRMICPKCGAEMNHHADKLVEPGRVADALEPAPDLEGAVEEIHGCPRCGNVEMRHTR